MWPEATTRLWRIAALALLSLGVTLWPGCRRTYDDGGGCSDPSTPTPGADATLPPGVDGGPLSSRPDAYVSPGTDGGRVVGTDAASPPRVDGPPATCGAVTGSFGGGMTMIGCVPELSDASPRPLVVALHGYTQSATEYLNTTEWDVLAGRYGFYVVFPQTPGNRAFDWYTAGRERGRTDPAAIMAMVERMQADHAIDPERIFVTGLSAGGYMAVSMLAGYPDVFAAGASFSGGPHGCSATCASSPSATPGAVARAYPAVWGDSSARHPRLMLVHGTRDGVVAPANLGFAVTQWTTALGIDAIEDNAAMGLPTTLKGHAYAVYTRDGTVMVATHVLEGLGHGTPVDPGDAVDQGGFDPMPGMEQPPGYFDPHDWTNTTTFYGPYYAARFFGIAD